MRRIALLFGSLVIFTGQVLSRQTGEDADVLKADSASTSLSRKPELSINPNAVGQGVITFSEYPTGTHIGEQYAESHGVIFGGDDPYITSDGSNPSSPVLSGTPLFAGAIEGRFVDQTTLMQTTVSDFVLNAGYFDKAFSTKLTCYGENDSLVGVASNSTTGIISLGCSSEAGIARWRIELAGDEPAGFAIDNVAINVHPSIEVVLKSAPVGNEYKISDAPEMPEIVASARVLGVTPDPTYSTSFNWLADVTVMKGTGGSVSYDDFVVQNEVTIGDEEYTLHVIDQDDIVGGSVTLNVSALINGIEVKGESETLTIVGTNPARATLQAELDSEIQDELFSGLAPVDVADALKRIGCHETANYSGGQVQFKGEAGGGTGPVIISSDNGIGIFQITKTTAAPAPFDDPNILFNWRRNVEVAVAAFKEKTGVAVRYPARLTRNKNFQSWIEDSVNPVRIEMGLMPIVNLTLPEYTQEGPMSPDESRNQHLHDSVRGYNGYPGYLELPAQPTGEDVYRVAFLHEFRPDAVFLETVPDDGLLTLSMNPDVWQVVPAEDRPDSGEPNYVVLVEAKSPTCDY